MDDGFRNVKRWGLVSEDDPRERALPKTLEATCREKKLALSRLVVDFPLSEMDDRFKNVKRWGCASEDDPRERTLPKTLEATRREINLRCPVEWSTSSPPLSLSCVVVDFRHPTTHET